LTIFPAGPDDEPYMLADRSELDVSDDLEQSESYSTVSLWAVVSLSLGLASALVLVHPLLAFIPALAVATSLAALRQIEHYKPAYVGRRAALAGLALAVFFVAAFLSRWVVEYRVAATQARRFGARVVELLATGNPMEAHQLTLGAASRMAPDESMLELYRADRAMSDGLRSFTEEPVVRVLLELGEQARVRFYATDMVQASGDDAIVSQIFAVTYEENGERKTFFVRLLLARERRPGESQPHWKLIKVLGDVRPDDFSSEK